MGNERIRLGRQRVAEQSRNNNSHQACFILSVEQGSECVESGTIHIRTVIMHASLVLYARDLLSRYDYICCRTFIVKALRVS
jgi:hypothetical protein